MSTSAPSSSGAAASCGDIPLGHNVTKKLPHTHVCGPALQFELEAVDGRARASTLRMHHGAVHTPVFMPVGTQGTIKGLTPTEVAAPPQDCKIILGNTYHLGNRPGGDAVEALGGLHKMMGWDRCILTDSGGFQMVSLLHLAEITEQGVEFQSPADGSRMLLTPEMSMHLQNQIGSDIMMALDDVVDSKTVDDERFTEACHRTLRWIDRCIEAHARKDEQNLFGIIQGGLDVSPGGLRDICLKGMLERDAQLPGYAIGGLAGGEDKDDFWRVVAHCCEHLPTHKPRYLMGVGYPLDLVVCSALGVDMYDCVYPTRTARFGTALVPWGLLKLKHAACGKDHRPIDSTCPCVACTQYSRAQLHAMLKAETGAAQLITQHNITYMLRLTRGMRAAVHAGKYTQFVQAYLSGMFPEGPHTVPKWVQDALAHVGMPLGEWGPDSPHVAPLLEEAAAPAVPIPTCPLLLQAREEATAALSAKKAAKEARKAAAKAAKIGGVPRAATDDANDSHSKRARTG